MDTKNVDSANNNGTEVPGAGVTAAEDAAGQGRAEETAEAVEFTDTEETERSGGAADGTGKDAAEGGSKQAEEDKPWKNRHNAEQARLRREREKQEAVTKARADADTAAIIEALGGKNPYTGAEMKDTEDVKAWRRMRAIEKAGGDPLTDYAAKVADDARAEAAEAASRRQKEEQAEKDWKDFSSAHPDMPWDKLAADESFMAYAEGKLGVMPLSRIWDGYQTLVSRFGKQATEAEQAAAKRAAQAIANGMASPGSATGESGEEGERLLSEEEVAGKSAKWIAENYDLVWKSQQRWNNKTQKGK